VEWEGNVKNIAIVGAGWYGLHLAKVLKENGFGVRVFEKNKNILEEASILNQSRLHQGFHYPRSALTRTQSMEGYQRFLIEYPTLSSPIEENYYLIPKHVSLVDYDTFCLIMNSSGLDFSELNKNSIDFINLLKIEGAIKCDERILNSKLTREYFQKLLSENISLGHKIQSIPLNDYFFRIDNQNFDFLVDATWGSLENLNNDYYYEATILFYIKCLNDKFPCITLVDGNFWSIYATETTGIYTLSSVKNTPLNAFNNKQDAYKFLLNLTTKEIDRKKDLMTREVIDYFPKFLEFFNFLSPQLSIKTKKNSLAADRSVSVIKSGNKFSIISGKIDNIFIVSDFILNEIR